MYIYLSLPKKYTSTPIEGIFIIAEGQQKQYHQQVFCNNKRTF